MVFLFLQSSGGSSTPKCPAEDIRQLLAIPPEVDPITLIPLGYPDEKPEAKVVRPLPEMVLYETFGK